MSDEKNAKSDINTDSALVAGLDALGHGLAVWSDQDVLVSCNIEFRNRFALDSNTIPNGLDLVTFLTRLARSGLMVLPSKDDVWVSNELAAIKKRGQSEYVFRDGTIHVVERWAIPTGGYICLLKDITEFRRDQRALQKASDEAKASDVSKSRFLQAANHDLRQPLASLKILIYNCMSAADEEHRTQLLHAMDVSVSIMEDLLGALLNIGQLDAGVVTPRVTTFQLSSLLERLEVQFGHQAREKGLQFKLVPSKLAVVSDRALLERIVSNFVSNAIRYTSIGSVVVGCRRHGKGIRLEVRDSGSGIDAKYTEAIFDEFFRCADEQTKHQHSLGLGLNISKRLADVLKHKISVKTELGSGSIFAIELPVGDIWHSDIGEIAINESMGGEFAGLSALVLEDDENLLEALTELLERWGISVSTIGSFDDIDSYCDSLEENPDIIVTDYRLKGGVEGTRVVEQIRQKLNIKCPALVVTADTNPELIAGIRSAGFPVLIKPVSPPSLRVMMHNVLYEPELIKELRTKSSRENSH